MGFQIFIEGTSVHIPRSAEEPDDLLAAVGEWLKGQTLRRAMEVCESYVTDADGKPLEVTIALVLGSGGATREQRREALAALEHEQWAHWTAYMLGLLQPVLDAGMVRLNGMKHQDEITPELDAKYAQARGSLSRWRKQIDTPYADLSEMEKDSDRQWADKVLDTMRAAALGLLL